MALLWIIVLYFTIAGALGCDDQSPDKELTCPELMSLGSRLCLEDFMIRNNFCAESCGRAPCAPKDLNLQEGSAVVLEGKRTGQKQFRRQFPTPSPSPSPSPSPVSPSPVMVSPPAPPSIPVPPPSPAQFPEVASPIPVPMVESIPCPPSSGNLKHPPPSPSPSPSPSTSPAASVSEPAADLFFPSNPETFLETTEPTADETGQESLDGTQCQTPFKFLASRSDLSFFKQVAERFGFSDSFSSPNFLVTAFVPNDEAFRHLFRVLRISEEAFLQGNKNVIQQLLQVHLVPGQIFISETGGKKRLPTQLSSRQELEIDGKLVTSPGGPKASVIEADISLCKTLVHIVDGVLIPAPIVELQKSLLE